MECLPVDGSCDSELKVKDIEGLDTGNWRQGGYRIPLENQDTEMDEDGDALGAEIRDFDL